MLSTIRKSLAASGLLAVATLTAGAAAGQEEPVDRVLAVVDEETILASDVEQVIALGLVERQEEESEEAFRQRALQELIEQKLRFHEIDRYGFTELPVQRVEEEFTELRRRHADDGAWQARLAELGLDEQGVKALVARQLLVFTYIEERLGPRVFVSLDDIQEYYDTVLVPEMNRRGAAVPPIDEVREQIREVLRQQRLNEELERWTEELRRDADIADYSDVDHEELPPVVDRRP